MSALAVVTDVWGRPRVVIPPIDRLMQKVTRDPATGCWEFAGHHNRSGYSTIADEHRVSRLAHRVSYVALVGPIPEGLDLDHLCRNRGCVNPAHLEAVTHQVNMSRGAQGQAVHCLRDHKLPPVHSGSKRDCLECRRIRGRARVLCPLCGSEVAQSRLSSHKKTNKCSEGSK